MKSRDRLIALLCILLFVGGGILVFKKWVIQKPFGIILFVSDGLDTRTLEAARQFAGVNRLHMEEMPGIGLLQYHASDSPLVDSAAAASLLSGGIPVAWGSTPPEQAKLLTESATASGRVVGFVSNDSVAGPVAAAFSMRNGDLNNAAAIAQGLLAGGRFDLVLGGGRAAFFPAVKGGARQDAEDLLLNAKRDGYESARNAEEWEAIPAWKRSKVLGLFADGPMAFRSDAGSASFQPRLADLVQKSIQIMQTRAGGYLLVVDAGLVRRGAIQRSPVDLLDEMVALDEAIRVAHLYAGKSSLIVVAGTSTTGGLALSGKAYPGQTGAGLLGNNPAGNPFLEWNAPATSPEVGALQLFMTNGTDWLPPKGLIRAEDLHAWLLERM